MGHPSQGTILFRCGRGKLSLWVLHFARHESLPPAIEGSAIELGSIRALVDFLCFEDMLGYVDGKLASCTERQDEIRALKQAICEMKKENEEAHEEQRRLLRDAKMERYTLWKK